jgi:hypothetical protein
VLKPVFFDQNANKLECVTSDDVDEVVPKFCRLSVLSQWSTITQGTYGATLKPKAQQFRVYPNEQLATDECLLNDDGEEEYDIGDALGNGDFSGGAKVTQLNNAAPAPLDMGEHETVGAVETVDVVETVEVIGEGTDPEPVAHAAPVVTRQVRTVTRPARRAVVAKKT